MVDGVFWPLDYQALTGPGKYALDTKTSVHWQQVVGDQIANGIDHHAWYTSYVPNLSITPEAC